MQFVKFLFFYNLSKAFHSETGESNSHLNYVFFFNQVCEALLAEETSIELNGQKRISGGKPCSNS